MDPRRWGTRCALEDFGQHESRLYRVLTSGSINSTPQTPNSWIKSTEIVARAGLSPVCQGSKSLDRATGYCQRTTNTCLKRWGVSQAEIDQRPKA